MPGLKDNQEISVAVNQYGSIKQKDSQRGDGVYYSLDCLVDGRKEKIWGMLTFVFLFRSAEGLLLVEAPLFLQAPLEELL